MIFRIIAICKNEGIKKDKSFQTYYFILVTNLLELNGTGFINCLNDLRSYYRLINNDNAGILTYGFWRTQLLFFLPMGRADTEVLFKIPIMEQ